MRDSVVFAVGAGASEAFATDLATGFGVLSGAAFCLAGSFFAVVVGGRRLASVANGSTAGRAANRGPQHEDPPDVLYGLASDESTLVEQPGVLTVELLERVVRENVGGRTIGDLQDERVAAADRTGRRSHEFAVEHGFFVGLVLLRIDAMAERCVDDNGRIFVRIFREQGAHSVVELRKAWRGAPFRRDVRPVHHDMFSLHLRHKSSKHSRLCCGSFTNSTHDVRSRRA